MAKFSTLAALYPINIDEAINLLQKFSYFYEGIILRFACDTLKNETITTLLKCHTK
jgi:hypothetical protein